MMVIITVLDFYTGEVHFHEVDEKIPQDQNIEDHLYRWGYELSNIQYMVTKKNKVKIQELNKIYD